MEMQRPLAAPAALAALAALAATVPVVQAAPAAPGLAAQAATSPLQTTLPSPPVAVSPMASLSVRRAATAWVGSGEPVAKESVVWARSEARVAEQEIRPLPSRIRLEVQRPLAARVARVARVARAAAHSEGAAAPGAQELVETAVPSPSPITTPLRRSAPRLTA